MANKRKFLDFFKMKDLDDDDEFDDDLFDEDDDYDDDDDDDYAPKSKSKYSFGKSSESSQPATSHTNYNQTQAQTYKNNSQPAYSSPKSSGRTGGKLLDFNNRPQRQESHRGSEVYVIKPQEIGESQTVTDCLKSGKTIVINMEGLELSAAQRIIDFIGGACYALDGSLQAISANIFIAAPSTIEVSGDLREEILNESTVSPQLGRY